MQLCAERTRELAIRRALGATGRSLVHLMIRGITAPTSTGLLLGVVLSAWIVPLARRFLFRTSPFDPLIWLSAGVLLLAAAVFAVWLPARRVHSIDPAMVLRQE